MVPLTRRTLLSGVAGLTAALAGCSGLRGGSAGSTSTAPRDDDDADADGPAVGSTSDPEMLLVRTDADRPPVWFGNADERPTSGPRTHWRNHVVVDDSDRAERIRVAESVDRDRIASFFDATEFDGETVYVEMARVGECFEHELCRVGWSTGEISTDYTRLTRPYTTDCAVDASVFEARFIRIPDALDADEVNSYSSSVGGGACDSQRGGVAGEVDTESSTSESTARTETPTLTSGTETPPTSSQGDQ